MSWGQWAALTGLALMIGALGAVLLWWARLPGWMALVRTLGLPMLVVMVVVLTGLVVAQLAGHSVVPGNRRRLVTRTRLLLGWYVLAGVMLARDVPLLLNVMISGPALESQVRMVRSGRTVTVPNRVGGFPVTGASRDSPGPGQISLDLADDTQLVYSETGGEENNEYLHHITGHWYWYRWEGA